MALVTENIPVTRSARDSLIAMAVLWLLFATTVGFRIRGRLRGPRLGLDDILSVIALITSTSTIGLNAAVFTRGVGYDFDPNSPVYPKLVINLPFIMQITFAYTLVYIWTLAALKLSQLALYLRVFARELSTLIYIVDTIVVLWAIIFNFLFIFLCNPIAQQWTINRIGHCMDQILLLKCLIMTNLVTDLFIVALPVRCVWNLQMRKTEKFAVLACFGLGLACVVISLARFIQIYTINLIGNLTGTSLTTFMLCTVELMLAGLCINLPMLRPFYLQWREKHSSSALSKSERQSNPKLWIELEDKDRSHVPGTHDDTGSEEGLTVERPSDRIHVSKDWVVTRN